MHYKSHLSIAMIKLWRSTDLSNLLFNEEIPVLLLLHSSWSLEGSWNSPLYSPLHKLAWAPSPPPQLCPIFFFFKDLPVFPVCYSWSQLPSPEREQRVAENLLLLVLQSLLCLQPPSSPLLHWKEILLPAFLFWIANGGSLCCPRKFLGCVPATAYLRKNCQI